MPFVFKVKYESTLRRMIVKDAKDGTPDLTFKDLEAKIQNMFQIPIDNRLVVTYMDQDNEMVTMGGDFDLHDACIVQRIDPLRMEVKLQKTKPDGVDHKEGPQTKSFQRSSVAHSLVDALKNPSNFSKMAALPDQLLSNDVKSSMKVAKVQEAPCSLHKGVQFHKDVQCDGCSMVTVVGPRFKSIRKERDHLCLRCFTGCVDQSDHQRYDNPIHSQRRHNHSMLHKGKMASYFSSQSTALALNPPHPPKVSARKHSCPGHEQAPRFSFNKGNHHSPKKLDSRFVQHLTFSDGTEVFVGTCFTKSWRLRNTGSLPWPSATQLVCVGGDVLGSQKPSTLKIPYCGLLSGEEIDASVDLVAPERPGRFVSYWRLMAPTGQKFGHRIWVVIQAISKPQQLSEAGESLVEQCHKQFVGMDKASQLVRSIGNAIEPSRVQSHKQVGAVEEHRQLTQSSGNDIEIPAGIVTHQGDDGAVPILDSLLLSTMDGEASLPPLPSVNEDGYKTMENSVLDLPCPVHPDAEHAEDSNLVKSVVGAFSLVEKPDVNLAQTGDLTTEPASPSQLLAEPIHSENSHTTIDPWLDKQMEFLEVAEDYELSDCQEDIILGMLNSMGFTQRTLNLELLRKNKNDMLETVDDLVVSSEWDHILDELEELGFYDADMNRRLLSKNNGSVKLVVKELMQMQTSWGGNESQY